MIIWGKEKTSVREVSMKSKTLLWLIPLILLLLLIPLAVPSALPAAGAEDLPLWETVELANPHPGPVPLDEKPPFAPDEAGWLPDEQGYVDGTIAVRLEKRVVNNTKVYITFVQIADPSQLRTASYKPYPQQAEIRATKLASREKAVVALNADWFVSNGGFGIILTCDKEGTKLVEKRLRGKLDDPKWFEGISDKQIRTEVKIGYLQYEKAKYNRNANEFKDDVEEEVNYDM